MRLKFKKNDIKDSHKCQTTVYLNGGLGNQLFQLAYGIEISRIRNSTLYLETILLDQDIKRNYALDIFGVPKNKSFELSASNIVLTGQSNICDCEHMEIRESQFFYTDNSSQIIKAGRLSIHGYWQSPLYFEDSSLSIKDFLKTSLMFDLKGEYAVLHIRRGDFLNDPVTRAFHGILTSEYYIAATRLIPSSVEKVYIISDDLDVAVSIKQDLADEFPEIFFEIFHDSKIEIQCFKLMSNASYVVAANSSFSWWGAFLSKNVLVVAPRNYFSSKTLRELNICDLYPTEWFLR